MTNGFNFGPMMEAYAGRFTVGFIAPEIQQSRSLGSGTLIRFGNVNGILTCAHVLEAVLANAEFGIVCFPVRSGEFQTLRVRSDLTGHVAIGQPPWNEQGPDLAFLRLPDAILMDLERLASIIDGMRHRGNALGGEPDTQDVVNLVCGVIEERTGSAETRRDIATTTFQALISPGNVIQRRTANGMDLFRFRPVPGKGETPPSSYEGSSGGGLWRLYVKREQDDTYSLIQSRLVGVAFWQTPFQNSFDLVCHGADSLYRVLFDRISAVWPQSAPDQT